VPIGGILMETVVLGGVGAAGPVPRGAITLTVGAGFGIGGTGAGGLTGVGGVMIGGCIGLPQS